MLQNPKSMLLGCLLTIHIKIKLLKTCKRHAHGEIKNLGTQHWTPRYNDKVMLQIHTEVMEMEQGYASNTTSNTTMP